MYFHIFLKTKSIDITDIDKEWPPIVNLKFDVIFIYFHIFLYISIYVML